MDILSKIEGDKSLITFQKERVVGTESETFQSLIQNSIDKGSKKILIDLSNVKYISSWGIGILVHAYTTCINRNTEFHLQGVNSDVMNVLNQLKLTQLFNIA